MNLNVQLMTRRRRELGLSARAMSRAACTSLTRIQPVLDGRNHESLTLREVERLANVLDLDPLDLLTAVPPHAPVETGTPPSTSDIIALLKTAGDHVPRAALAQAIDVTLDELDQLLPLVDRQLRTVGLRLGRHTNDASVCIRADSQRLADEQVSSVLRAKTDRLELDEATARVICQVLDSPTNLKALSASNDGRVRIGQLLNAGVVAEPHSDIEPMQLTDDVRESLLLDRY